MIVLSMKRCFARFTSSAWRCSHNCFQRPRASQRLKRLYTASQWPTACGKSRHGMPVRAIYNTASINMRSRCSAGLPSLCLIAAKMVAISAHAASVTTSLTLVISFPHDPITHHRGKDTYSRGNSSTRPSYLGRGRGYQFNRNLLDDFLSRGDYRGDSRDTSVADEWHDDAPNVSTGGSFDGLGASDIEASDVGRKGHLCTAGGWGPAGGDQRRRDRGRAGAVS